MNFDLNSFYSRYDNAGASDSYYGYINTNSSGTNFTNIADTAPAFSIRKTYYVGNVQYTDWSNNTMQAYESVWNDRTYCFATPSMTSVTASTYSDGYHTNMSISWTSVQGASRFQIKLSEDERVIMDLTNASSNSYNPNSNNNNTLLYKNVYTLLLQQVKTGHTYNISVKPINMAGSATASTLAITL